MGKRVWFALIGIISVGVGGAVDAQTPGSSPPTTFYPHREVHDAITAVRKVAMNRDRLDWAAIEARAQADAASAKDDADLLPVYARVLYQLDDNRHSMVIPLPPTAAAYQARYGDRSFLPERARRCCQSKANRSPHDAAGSLSAAA